MKLKTFTWLLAGFLFVGCSSDDENANESSQTGNEVNVESVLGLTEEQQAMVAPLNDFSVRLFQQLNSTAGDHSAVVSPLSTAFVLGMLNEGAEGITSSEIASALGMKGKEKAVVSKLFAQYISAIPVADNGVEVALANNVSVNNRYTLKDSYQAAMEKDYNASVFALDFSTPAAITAINSWCNQHTRGLIPSIAEELSSNDVLCLLNAIYFKARWADAFSKDNSLGGLFNSASGFKQMKMMTKTANMQYGEQRDLQALRLPLAQGKFAMTFVLPAEGKELGAFVRSLTAQQLSGLSFDEQPVEAVIPIFATTVDTDLIGLLQGIGVNRVFNGNAELAGMVNGEDDLMVSKMKQKTRIGVDEEGCEGAAVTLAELIQGADIGGGAPKPKIFAANRPFIYYISEVQSGTILFMGQFCGD